MLCTGPGLTFGRDVVAKGRADKYPINAFMSLSLTADIVRTASPPTTRLRYVWTKPSPWRLQALKAYPLEALTLELRTFNADARTQPCPGRLQAVEANPLEALALERNTFNTETRTTEPSPGRLRTVEAHPLEALALE